jgi:hypothetical protein
MPASRRNPHQRRELGRSRSGAPAQFSAAVPFYRDSRPIPQLRPLLASRTGWHVRCIGWLDPPFGGLWCDQPALFFVASLRRRVRHPAALRERAAVTGFRFPIRFRTVPVASFLRALGHGLGYLLSLGAGFRFR